MLHLTHPQILFKKQHFSWATHLAAQHAPMGSSGLPAWNALFGSPKQQAVDAV